MLTKARYLAIGALVMVVLSGGWIEQVHSQPKYPTRAIDIYVPLAAGASTDLTARLTAGYMAKKYGVPVNVINKPGGNTVIGSLEVYNAAPDGYTLLGDSINSCSVLAVAVKNLPFKIMDRSFIAITSGCGGVLTVPANSPFKTVADVVQEAKRDLASFTWTSLGGASFIDAFLRQFFRAAGIDYFKTKPIMCQGGSQAVVLTAGGHVKMGGATPTGALPAVQAKTVRVLAITGRTRDPEYPDVPTFEELGYPSVNLYNWNSLSGPPNLPPHIVGMLEKAMEEMTKDPEIIEKMKNLKMVPFYHNARESKEMVGNEIADLQKIFQAM
jgi:tripartite-type tricarboxylate transporter receptor subunit TctC